jgi:hypothetical protein
VFFVRQAPPAFRNGDTQIGWQIAGSVFSQVQLTPIFFQQKGHLHGGLFVGVVAVNGNVQSADYGLTGASALGALAWCFAFISARLALAAACFSLRASCLSFATSAGFAVAAAAVAAGGATTTAGAGATAGACANAPKVEMTRAEAISVCLSMGDFEVMATLPWILNCFGF